MSDRKINVDVLRNICTKVGNGTVITRKGGTAELTEEEYDHYIDLGAVKRIKAVKKEVAK